MTLKNFLKLVRADELINLYDPITNVYISCSKLKEEYKGQYDQCKVVGVNTNVDDGDNAVLEIDIWTN
jgi:radical SAM superfamily enzyme